MKLKSNNSPFFQMLNSKIASLDRSHDLALITRNARRLTTDELVPKRILVPSDFSRASDHAFTYASHLGSHFGATLHVIHVLEPILSPEFAGLPETSAFSKEEVATAKKAFRAWAKSARAAAAELVFRKGFAVHEIVEAAKELDIDLVIMAALGHTGSKHFCIGGTAERVVRAAPCPVLLVREKET
jgi:nucleotide-binding universal stress UspA family protein